MMLSELKKIENILFRNSPIEIFDLVEDKEAKDYAGCDFKTAHFNIKFRKAKITPKKNGQFVTLWKRNSNNETQPLDESDNVDFLIIVTEENNNYGFFLFPKNELLKRQILSRKQKEGKRGFRVYPSWTKTESKQAEKTQSWQTHYFVEVTSEFIDHQKQIYLF